MPLIITSVKVRKKELVLYEVQLESAHKMTMG